MADPSFLKQAEQPLFPDIFWNQPTMASRRGRLLIVGGHSSEFSLLQAAYEASIAAGIGESQVIMPDSLRKVVGETGYSRYAPASPSGSLGKAAQGEILEAAGEFDVLLLGLNLTNNAETGVMVEALITKLDMPVVITEETIKILKFNPLLITGNPRALVVVTMQGLFELANHHHMPIAIRPERGVLAKMEILEQLVSISKCAYVVFDQEVIVAAEGKISLTSLKQPLSELPGIALGVAATFWTQHQDKPFEALTAAAFVLAQAASSGKMSYRELSTRVGQSLKQLD